MGVINADRVKETSTTTGTGTYALDGAAAGFRTFVAGIGDGSSCHYVAEDGTDWEIGVGTVNDVGGPGELVRDRIIASSNAGAAVSWGAGTRNIFCSAVVEALEQRRVLTADQASTTVTTNVNVTGLDFQVKAGRRYMFSYGTLSRAAATTTGIRLSVTVPAFTKFGAVARVPTSTADGASTEFQGNITASGDQVVGTGHPATGLDYFSEVRGILVPSADGDLRLVYASEVAASAVTVAQGSYGRLLVLG